MRSSVIGPPLVDFVIIGAMKTGTSSLHSILRRLPTLNMSKTKETNFFITSRYYTSTFERGVEWYSSQFADIPGLKGESSPNYSKWPRSEGTAEAMFSMAPNLKLIYIVRNPVNRALSHYFHNLLKGRETRSIDDALLGLPAPYIDPGMYFMQLSPFLKCFDRSRFYIVTYERLWSRPYWHIPELLRFLGVNPSLAGISLDRRHNQTSKHIESLLSSTNRNAAQQAFCDLLSERNVAPTTSVVDLSGHLGFDLQKRWSLKERFREDTGKLSNFLGREISEWDES